MTTHTRHITIGVDPSLTLDVLDGIRRRQQKQQRREARVSRWKRLLRRFARRTAPTP